MFFEFAQPALHYFLRFLLWPGVVANLVAVVPLLLEELFQVGPSNIRRGLYY